MDNDCIVWSVPAAVERWLAADEENLCLIAEDVTVALGVFTSMAGGVPRNSGIRGLPPHFDYELALMLCLEQRGVILTSELDEQGLQTAAVSRRREPEVVSIDDVAICSPFPPHRPELGRCGAHFVGLNARSLPWTYEGENGSEWIRRHWRHHRDALYARVLDD
jgi:hypothetical protein